MNRIALILLLVVFAACKDSGKNGEKTDTPNKPEKPLAEEKHTSNKHTAPGGSFSFERPDGFGLAVNKDQILAKSYIPPCGEGFLYCLYYNGKKYENTNFESAGVGIYVLENTAENSCFSAEKFNGRKENFHTETISNVKFSVFSSGNAATGHYAKDIIYQTFQNGKCYRFVARIGTSQYQNYEPGTIEKFTPEMEDEMRSTLKEVLEDMDFLKK